jgi:hypothetical protein
MIIVYTSGAHRRARLDIEVLDLHRILESAIRSLEVDADTIEEDDINAILVHNRLAMAKDLLRELLIMDEREYKRATADF